MKEKQAKGRKLIIASEAAERSCFIEKREEN